MSNRPSLIKQLVGAVIGGSLGLLVYTAYEHSSPTVIAWLTIPQKDLASNGEGSRMADNDPNNKENIRFEARAREIAQEFGAAYKNYQVKEAAPASSAASSRVLLPRPIHRESPFRGAMEEEAASSVDSDASSSEDSSAGTEADRAQAVREMWNSENIERLPDRIPMHFRIQDLGCLELLCCGCGAGTTGKAQK